MTRKTLTQVIADKAKLIAELNSTIAKKNIDVELAQSLIRQAAELDKGTLWLERVTGENARFVSAKVYTK